MSQQPCFISYRFCTGAPMFLVVRDGVLVDWTFDRAKALQYASVSDADEHFQWLVESMKNAKPAPKVYPALLAPLHSNRFSLIELAIERLESNGKRFEAEPLRWVRLDLRAIKRSLPDAVSDTYYPSGTSSVPVVGQSGAPGTDRELPRSVPRQ